MNEQQKRILRWALIGLVIAAALLLAGLAAYHIWEKPPELAAAVLKNQGEASPSPSPAAVTSRPRATEKPTQTPAPTPTEEPLPEGEAIETSRQDGVFTVLLVGNDNGNGNTDTIILGKIDTVQHQMDFVSIPRDTLINAPWRVRRINTVYWGTKHGGGDGIGALKRQVGKLAGFQPDCVAVIDLQAFMDAVDLIGGIWFDVPMEMDYEDWGQDLYIHLQPGYQLLDGYQSMCLCRFRSGYVTGDLGRIEMQQQFLSACASQFLSLGNVPKARELIKLLSEQMDTDLTAPNMAFLLRQYMACDEESIRFHVAPCSVANFGGCSYALLQVDPWLELINTYLNPYDSPIRYRNVDIVYLKGDGVGCTGKLQDPDYYAPPPSPSPEPTEEPTPEPEAAPTEEPEPTPTEDGEGETEIATPSPVPAPEPEPEPTQEPEPTEDSADVVLTEP